MTDRKHVQPAHEGAAIPDPTRGRDLPPEGQPVSWTPYWAGLERRGDIIVSDVADEEPEAERAAAPDPEPNEHAGEPEAASEPETKQEEAAEEGA